MHDLLLTLGHNSSAILVEQDVDRGRIVCGYEEERLTHKKSESQFPVLAIFRCLEVANINKVDKVYVTHWAPHGQLDGMVKKHWDPLKLPTHSQIVTHNGHNTTHHDMHAWAALWYADSVPHKRLRYQDTMILVADGFGNFGEHLSIYKISESGGIGGGSSPLVYPIQRFFGYDGSLGLMYQYMTAFLGMKQHEDEYKILGYETHIDEVDVDRGELASVISRETDHYLRQYFHPPVFSKFDPLLKVDALPAVQVAMIDRWTKICKRLDIDDPTSFKGRVVLGHMVQAVLEAVITTVIKTHCGTCKNLIVAGGVFYNVKLNRVILDLIPGKLCIYPLAGDQGNAIGLYVYEQPLSKLEWPGHFNWGIRPTNQISSRPANFYAVKQATLAADLCAQELMKSGTVNLVRGAMEFGPRALCNTSTLAVPTPGLVAKINRMNGRSTVMPMAPVMHHATYAAIMGLTHKVHLSEQHMIVALPYQPGYGEEYLGAAHRYPHEYTGRPQVVEDDLIMDHLLSNHEVLINTSFNVHGRPIVYSYEDAIFNHKKQNEVFPITTVYLETS